jgi:hypothetical protein
MRMRRTGAVVVVAVVGATGAGLLAAVVLDELLPHPAMLRANASTLTTQTLGFRRSMIFPYLPKLDQLCDGGRPT